MLRVITLCLAGVTIACGESLEFDLKAGQAASVTLPSKVDDSHFRLPPGYDVPAEAPRLLTRSVEMLNTSGKTMTGRLLVMNRRDLQSAEGLKIVLGNTDGRMALERLYMFWKDHRFHAGSGAKIADEPFAALHFWGCTLPGEDPMALARLAQIYEIDARWVQLNGHLAAEYIYDGGWHMIDADQNTCYLQLDNRTIASAAEVRADPFLALRTKVFGRSRPMSRAAATINTALFEQIALVEPKPIRLKMGPAPLNTFTLEPGEMLRWLCDQPPPSVAGKLVAENPTVFGAAALATIEHRINLVQRRRPDPAAIVIYEPFPILKIVNETTGESATPKDVAFKASIPVKADTDKITVLMQCSQQALPLLSKGDNIASLEADQGKAHIVYKYQPVPAATLASVRATPAVKDGKFSGAPSFTLTGLEKADHIWWQISFSGDFTFVPPNFDTVAAAAKELKFDPFTETFFSPGRPYFLRLKARTAGVWSEWSPAVEFRVERPSQPSDPRFTAMPGGGLRLAWAGVADEYLVYGSNRLDFVPEPFGAEEIVAMDQGKVTDKRPNKNLIATVKSPEIALPQDFRFYRVIARHSGASSVPSALWTVPKDLAAKFPPATVLQFRTTKVDGKTTARIAEEKLPAPK